MWIALTVVVLVLAAAAIVWRLAVIGRRTPTDNDRSRQHEVPEAHRR